MFHRKSPQKICGEIVFFGDEKNVKNEEKSLKTGN